MVALFIPTTIDEIEIELQEDEDLCEICGDSYFICNETGDCEFAPDLWENLED